MVYKSSEYIKYDQNHGYIRIEGENFRKNSFSSHLIQNMVCVCARHLILTIGIYIFRFGCARSFYYTPQNIHGLCVLCTRRIFNFVYITNNWSVRWFLQTPKLPDKVVILHTHTKDSERARECESVGSASERETE